MRSPGPGNMKFRNYASYILSFLLLTLAGCSSTQEALGPAKSGSIEYHEITGEIIPDEAMAYFIEPYVAPIRHTMNRVLTVSEGSFTRAQPEGTLGNLAADILRSRAAYEMRTRVDVAIMNNGGLRIPLPEGDITVGQIFELMPFENHITVLKFSGNQILKLAGEIAAMGGEPVSGLRMRIQDGMARDVLVGHQNVNPERFYWVATNNWMADGGGDMPTLWEPIERVDHDLLIRDAFIEYLNHQTVIQPNIDHRLR